MASLTAAELQKRHALEGAPDPFPAFREETSSPRPSSSQANGKKVGFNTDSQDAFPSLAPSAAPQATAKVPAWGSGNATKARTAPPKPVGVTASVSLVVGTVTDRDGKVLTLSTVMKKIQQETSVSLEASTQKKTSLTTFFIKGPNAKTVEQATKLLRARLSKIVTLTVDAPLSTLGTIIGPKGATLKRITDLTGCRINIPKKDDAGAASAPPTQADLSTDSDSEAEEEADEPTTTITIAGPEPSALEAQREIQSLVGERTSKTTVRIKDIPPSFFPFVSAKVPQLEKTYGSDVGKELRVHVPPPAMLKVFKAQADLLESGAGVTDPLDVESSVGGKKDKKDLRLVVSGDKEAVGKTVQAIHEIHEDLISNTSTLSVQIPKRQHRFLVGANADEILSAHGCIVELPSIEDPSDNVVIRGPSQQLALALGAAMVKANSIAVESLDLCSLHRSHSSPSSSALPFDPVTHGKGLLRYLHRSSKLRQIAEANNVKIYTPFANQIESLDQVNLEIVGEDRESVKAVKKELVELGKGLGPGRMEVIEIDQLVHKFLIGKGGLKMQKFSSEHGVGVIFPPSSSTTPSDDVLLICPPVPNEAQPTSAADIKARDLKIKEKLAFVKDELLKLAQEAEDIKTRVLDIESKWHAAVIGKGGVVLNALIGEEKAVSVKVGSTGTSGDDTITIRGPSGEVDRVEKEILNIVKDAKEDLAINGYTVEFAVDKAYVGHLVGSAGSSINKLRDDLGVRVNFDDASPNGAAVDNKKKSTGAKATCKIVGQRAPVEEAKRRLLAQVERLADETTISVVIPRKYHASLIGSSGKYAIRLEEKYGVKITFPRDKESDQKSDEVLLRGGKKGVASAKAELLEAVEYEKETGQSLTFTIPSRAVAKVLGKAGSQINEIKEETDAQIDVEKAEGGAKETTITVLGTKKAILAAKAAILAISETVGEEITTTVEIDNQYHRTLIGPGGSRLREIVASCGGPSDARAQSGLVSFPKGAENTSAVRLRGEPSLIAKIKDELERIVSELKDRIILGVSVPLTLHASKIGRGGSALNDLQQKTNTVIQFPGSRQYGSFGEPENASELTEADPKTIVKVAGSRSAVEAAIEQLSIQPDAPPSRTRTPQPDQLSETVSIPEKYVFAITRGFLFRNLRSAGVIVENPPVAEQEDLPRPTKKSAEGSAEKGSTRDERPTGRIDQDDDDEAYGAYESELDYQFEIYDRYANKDETSVEWVLKSRNQASLDKAKKVIEEAVQSAEQARYVGILAGLPQSSFARIVGSKGTTVSRLRAESGAEIIVGKGDSDIIQIIGDKESILHAKEAIVEIASLPDRY
ncbi:Vigilin [Phaffia rhodozyma]|uniref:Vigilin n=1 Tax=Phaffia rhodozyma TaxID=264483 RepID=A0A0F7SKU2_PHARH|nr:Vigilin [Phaffia rhodozyma]